MKQSLQNLPSVEELRAELCNRSLARFVQFAWPTLEPKSELKWNWHHDVICEHLEAAANNDINRLVINIPFRETKSTLVSVCFPAWLWLHDETVKLLTGSHSMSLATRDAVKTRRLLESEWFKSLWPGKIKFTSDQNTKTRYDIKGGGYRIVFGMGSGVTGEGGDYLIIDDPHPAKDGMWSQINRDSVKDSYDHELCTRLSDPQKSVIVIVMQRLHEDDLTGHVLQEQGWTHLCLPMEYDSSRPCKTTVVPRNFDGVFDGSSTYIQDQRTIDGELLHEKRFDRDTVEKLKARLGAFGYAGQCQQQPAPLSGGMFKAEWWKHWSELPTRFDMVIVSLDATFKETTKGSFVVGQLWGASKGERYLLDQFRDRLDFIGTLNSLVRFVSKSTYKIDAIVIEEKANGSAILSVLKQKFPNIIGFNPHQDSKETRAAAQLPQFEAGSVLVPVIETHPWVADYIYEFTNFPRGATDDQVDATSQALCYMNNNAAISSTSDFDIESLLSGSHRSQWNTMDHSCDDDYENENLIGI